MNEHSFIYQSSLSPVKQKCIIQLKNVFIYYIKIQYLILYIAGSWKN